MSATISRRRFLSGVVLFCGAALTGTAVFPSFARDVQTLSAPEALEAVERGDLLLIDIRQPQEWQGSGIPKGSVPLDMRRRDFLDRLIALRRENPQKQVALICAAGVRSAHLAGLLRKAGMDDVLDVSEGMFGSPAGPGWMRRGLPRQKP